MATKKEPSQKRLLNYWWQSKEDQVHAAVFPIVKYLHQNQSYRRDRDLIHMRLYGNMDIAGMVGREYFHDNSPKAQSKIKLNVCKSVVDTVVAKMAKNRPRPMFLTDGGNHKKKMKAKRLNKYVEGAFQGMKIWDKGPDLVTDAGVFDLGALHFYTDKGKVKCERALATEILVDDQEGIYRDPRTLFRVKAIAREVMLANYPDFEAEILKVAKAKGNTNAKSMTDLIDVVEAWHLPSEEDKSDGLHSICIENATLFSEQYEIEVFPFVFFRWSDRLVGWYGQGIVEQLVGLQIEINRVLRTIQEAIKWSVPKVFVEAGSKVVPFSNLIMGHMKYTGKKPEIEAVNSVPQVLWDHLMFLYQKSYELIGVSQLAAQSKKPEGLDSGKAMREFSDIESDRFVVAGQRYEQVYLDAAHITIQLTRQLYTEDKGLKVRYKDRKGVMFIKWSEVDMDDNDFELTMWPTNLLSQTPSGKLNDINDMMNMGIMGPEEGRRLINYPDVESVLGNKNAPFEIMDMIIEKLLDGDYIAPEPYFKLDYAIPAMQDAYLKARIDDADQETLELMRRWIDQAKAIMDKAIKKPTAAAGSVAGPPEQMSPSGPTPGMEAPQMMPPDVPIQ